ncbi:MAG TPA: methyltransferase domain-containing protein [Candidatus Polarisedimenticolaceae bacterium]|nr:methyltransferase domain-containing protein [Candidatus Polarisedimenticolaceae bacterium]
MERSRTADRVAVDHARTQRVYSVLAKVYDDFFDWALTPGRRLAVSRLPARPGDRILEVGVGTGLSLPLYPRDCEVTGIDISEPMLEKARGRLDALGREAVVLRRMDAHDLRFPDASFDHVVAPYVISVVAEPEKVMREIRRVCRPGGTVLVVNHFLSDSFLLSAIERILTPASQWIGFRMDLPVRIALEVPGLTLQAMERVNLFGLWRLLTLRRD